MYTSSYRYLVPIREMSETGQDLCETPQNFSPLSREKLPYNAPDSDVSHHGVNADLISHPS